MSWSEDIEVSTISGGMPPPTPWRKISRVLLLEMIAGRLTVSLNTNPNRTKSCYRLGTKTSKLLVFHGKSLSWDRRVYSWTSGRSRPGKSLCEGTGVFVKPSRPLTLGTKWPLLNPCVYNCQNFRWCVELYFLFGLPRPPSPSGSCYLLSRSLF